MEKSSDPFCFIIPPYLLAAIASADDVPPDERDSARRTLKHDAQAQTISRDGHNASEATAAIQSLHPSLVPEHVLRGLAESSEIEAKERDNAQRTLSSLQKLRLYSKLQPAASDLISQTQQQGHLWREIYDANHSEDMESLPGILLRAEGEESFKSHSHDTVLNECYKNFKHTFDFFHQVFGRDSINARGLPLVAHIHYSSTYDNAFWVPNLRQMVFGDGGQYLCNFTSLDVIAHELTHGITQCTAALEYQGQAGALNESMSDVFGSMVKQYALDQDAIDADWLIGEDCLLPTVKGLALRSMKDPGSAYDKLGFAKDPQPASMANFVNTTSDYGGVHINSGIPNRAFYLCATRLGGKSWERAGQIWYLALTGNLIRPNCTFKQFADLTCDIAGKTFNKEVQATTKQAWIDVGVYEGITFTPTYAHGDEPVGLGGYDLLSPGDRAFALDYNHSGLLDHIVLYRPGTGVISIVKDEGSGTDFSAVYQQTAPGNGIGGYNLISADDRGFAFDYNHNGKLDHVVFYQPGEGILWILKHNESWVPVFRFREPGKGMGGYDLRTKADRAFAFDWDHSGKLDHIVLYRPGAGMLWVMKNSNGVFSPVYRTSEGLGSYDLSSPSDRVAAFDYEHIGKADHLILYRPGTGMISIFRNRNNKFSAVFNSNLTAGGIGGYDLMSPLDHLLAYDLEGTGCLEYLVLYRPGTGAVCVLKNHRGDFSPVYQEGDPGAGIGGFDLSSTTDRAFMYQVGGKGASGQIALYRPGHGIFWTTKVSSHTA